MRPPTARRSTAYSASQATSISTVIAFAGGQPQGAGTPTVGDDPLILLGGLSDGLILPMTEPSATAAPKSPLSFDFGADAHAVVHLDDGAGWNAADGTFDFLA